MQFMPRGIAWGGIILITTQLQSLRVILEEIGVECHTEPVEQLGVNIGARKDTVDISAGTMNFAAQPGDASFLAAQFIFNYFTDKNRLGIRTVSVVGLHIKSFRRTCGQFLSLSGHNTCCNDCEPAVRVKSKYCKRDATVI